MIVKIFMLLYHSAFCMTLHAHFFRQFHLISFTSLAESCFTWSHKTLIFSLGSNYKSDLDLTKILSTDLLDILLVPQTLSFTCYFISPPWGYMWWWSASNRVYFFHLLAGFRLFHMNFWPPWDLAKSGEKIDWYRGGVCFFK